MNSPAPAPEEWLTDSVVGKMWELLKNPHKEHGDVARDMLDGQPLLAAHIHSLARALVSDKRFRALHEKGGRGSSVALHIILFHIGGGADAKLVPPPEAADRDATLWTAHFFRDAKKAYLQLYSTRDAYKSKKKWAELADLRRPPYELHLKLGPAKALEVRSTHMPIMYMCMCMLCMCICMYAYMHICVCSS
jgi:hypothetical protein